jgi:MFS family permease
VTFAAFLLFWGGVLDLYPAKTVFTAGFVIVGLCNLVLSFLTDAYAFFVIRALQGVAAASVVPSAYRLIACTFPPAERQRAYTLYGMTGSIANVTATIIAGVIDLIPSGGQMRSWRWFLRIVAAVSCVAPGCIHRRSTDEWSQPARGADEPSPHPSRPPRKREARRLEAARLYRHPVVGACIPIAGPV